MLEPLRGGAWVWKRGIQHIKLLVCHAHLNLSLQLHCMQTTLQVPKARLQIQSDICDDERKSLLHSNSGTINGSMKKSGIAVRQRHVHFSEINTEKEMKGSQLPHKDCDVRCYYS